MQTTFSDPNITHTSTLPVLTDPNTTLTCSNPLTEQFDEAAVAVRFVVLFFKGSFVELLQTEGTHKVLGVKLFGHGCDAASCDWFLTAGAERASTFMVMHFTVRLAVVLEETSIHKRGEALPANKTLGVPEAAQR